MRPDEEPRFSWICRNEFERARFMDLHGRLLQANLKIMLALAVVIAAALPFISDRIGVLPAAAGMVLFGAIQQRAKQFARPELWVFGALLGAETLIATAIVAHGGGTSPAMALLLWPVAGVAGRFPNRASRIGTAYALVLAAVVVLLGEPGLLARDSLSLTLLLIGIASAHTVSTVLRDSDVEHRSAAILDPLTGMLNRAALNNRTAEIEFQSRLTGEPVAVVLLDLDRFKLVNDTRGHATGDTVLREVAYRLRKALRAYDLVYRIGGEEFVVLLLGATPTATSATAEGLRAVVASEPIVGLDLTVSVGVAASSRGVAFNWDEVFARADTALYRAKAEGRNRVAIEPPLPVAFALSPA
jgi:diguanylate cyclase (GGDEF)-like protein